MLNLLAKGASLAEDAPPPPRNNFGDTLGDGPAGPLALLIIVLLAIATVLLIRNMNARLRRLPAEFPAATGAIVTGDGAAMASATTVGGGVAGKGATGGGAVADAATTVSDDAPGGDGPAGDATIASSNGNAGGN